MTEKLTPRGASDVTLTDRDGRRFRPERIEIAGEVFDLLVRREIAGAEMFNGPAQEIPAEDPHEQNPYWGTVWPAAREMGAWVLRQTWPPQQPLLELGCGVGLVGVAAMRRGASVVFSDVVPEAVRLAVGNAGRNVGGSPWGLVMDWADPAVGPFGCVLGADILYDRDEYSRLLHGLRRMLAPEGTCWIAEPGRSWAPEFMELASRNDFAVDCFDQDRWRLIRIRKR